MLKNGFSEKFLRYLENLQLRVVCRAITVFVILLGFSNFTALIPNYVHYLPQIPLWSFLLHFPESYYYFLKLVLLASGLLFALGFFMPFSGLLSALMVLSISVINMKDILPFDFLPFFALLALSIEESLRKFNKNLTKFSFPMEIIVVCSVYFFASFHKSFNFTEMMASKYNLLRFFYNGYMHDACLNQRCTAIELLFYFVVPVEFLLALTIFIKKFRRWGLFLAFIFHLSISLLTTVIWAGLMMMLLECYYITNLLDITGKDFFEFFKRNKYLRVLLYIVSLLTVILLFISENSLAYANKFKVPYFFLFFTITNYHFFHSEVVKSKFNLRYSAGFMFLVALVFGFSPLLFNYSYNSIGWTMFSGGNLNAKLYELEVRPNPSACILPDRVGFVVKRKKNSADVISYVSHRAEYLTYLSEYLLSICPTIGLRTFSE